MPDGWVDYSVNGHMLVNWYRFCLVAGMNPPYVFVSETQKREEKGYPKIVTQR